MTMAIVIIFAVKSNR